MYPFLNNYNRFSMKKISLFTLSALVGGLFFFSSCTKETIETDKANGAVLQDNDIPNGRKTITYSVSVVSANGCQTSRVAGLSGARVTLVQGGVTVTRTTNQSGIAVFTNLGPGQVTGYAEAPGAVGMNFTAVLNTSNETSDVDQVEFAASMIALFETNGKAQGFVRADWDLNAVTNATFDRPVSIPGNPVMKVDFSLASATYLNVINGTPTATPRSGTITAVSLDKVSFSGSLITDGSYFINNIPTVPTGYGLTASLNMVDFGIPAPSGSTSNRQRVFRLNPVPVNTSLTPCAADLFIPDQTLTLLP
jgi:hypothetical protein